MWFKFTNRFDSPFAAALEAVVAVSTSVFASVFVVAAILPHTWFALLA